MSNILPMTNSKAATLGAPASPPPRLTSPSNSNLPASNLPEPAAIPNLSISTLPKSTNPLRQSNLRATERQSPSSLAKMVTSNPAPTAPVNSTHKPSLSASGSPYLN